MYIGSTSYSSLTAEDARGFIEYLKKQEIELRKQLESEKPKAKRSLQRKASSTSCVKKLKPLH